MQMMLIGIVDDYRFFNIPSDNVIVHGRYDREELIDLLYSNNINLVCLLSISPESYCLVLSEIMEAGIPVLASDIGALTERVVEADCGWLIPVDATSNQVLDLIHYIYDHPQEY